MGLFYSNAMGNAPYYAVISGTLHDLGGLKSPLDIPESVKSRTDMLLTDTTNTLFPHETARFSSKDMARNDVAKDVLGAYTSGIGSLTDANA